MMMTLQLFTGLLILSWTASSLDINESQSEITLSLFSSFSINCSAETSIVWKHDDYLIDSVLDYNDKTFTNTLTLQNVTGENTGLYTCMYNDSHHYKKPELNSIYIFVPDPAMVFLPIKPHDTFLFVLMRSETTIPCRVTNPNTIVTLHEKATGVDIPYPYDNQKGFTGHFDETNCYCKALLDGIEVNSGPFYIYTIHTRK